MDIFLLDSASMTGHLHTQQYTHSTLNWALS